MYKVINVVTGAIIAQYQVEEIVPVPTGQSSSPVWWNGLSPSERETRIQKNNKENAERVARNHQRITLASLVAKSLGEDYLMIDTGSMDCLGNLQ